MSSFFGNYTSFQGDRVGMLALICCLEINITLI